ncbi:MAG: ATP-NAD kinase family protein [Candidatus Bathyarchaeia archaeon]
MDRKSKSIGLIVNPIAGIGGSVGLKGTDGEDTLEKALSLGAKPVAPYRAETFLSHLKNLISGEVDLLVGAGWMGEFESNRVGLKYIVIGQRKDITTARDTKEVAEKTLKKGISLLVFCGGDGTARDILDVIGLSLPVLGVPSGVKMHSAVFAVNPEGAARVVSRFLLEGLPLKEAEVMDVDEEAFRENQLSAKLYGYMLVPYEPELIQGVKETSLSTKDELYNQAAIALYFIDKIMEPETVYILGPGTTTRAIAALLDERKTLLGVDLLLEGKIIRHDVNEADILEAIKSKRAKIVVTPIGGQGFIFGRGNQQISPRVIRSAGPENIIVIATKHKIRGLSYLRVDTGDSELDQMLRGYMRVIIDYGEECLIPVK